MKNPLFVRAFGLASNVFLFSLAFVFVWLVPSWVGRPVSNVEQWVLFLMVVGDAYWLQSKLLPEDKKQS